MQSTHRTIWKVLRIVMPVLTVILLCNQPSYAQLSQKPNRHVVVLIDADPAPIYRSYLENGSPLPSIIAKYLQEQKLYRNGDFLTIANYSFNLAETNGKNFSTFVTIPSGENKEPLAWMQLKESNPLGSLSSNWASISSGQHIAQQPEGSVRGSLNSMRLFFTIKNTGVPNGKSGANSLYIVTISDDLHQGNDNIAGEFRTLFSISNLSTSSKNLLEKQARQISNEVKRNFSFIDTDSKTIATGAFNNGTAFPYQMKITEVRAAREPSIQNILHLPAMPELKRVRGGYKLDIKKPQVDSAYTLEKLELTLTSSKGTKTYTSIGGKGIEVDIPFSEISDKQPEATLRAWVRLKDGLYNSLVLNPYDKDNQGLAMSQRLVAREEAKIFGVLKVSDTFWPPFIKSYDTVVTTYTLLLTIIITIAILIFGYVVLKKIGTYEPKDKDIKLRHL